jgi:restriction endonuclease Mrr
VSAVLDGQERRALRLKARAATVDALRALGGEARRDAIRDHALANGGFTPRELAAEPPEEVRDKYPRLVEHQLSWALTNLKRDGLVENPKWGVWRLAGAALETPGAAVEDPIGGDRLRELTTMPYHQYLRTPEWRRARAAALERAGHACSLDVTHTQELDVHHRTYERLGHELATDLVVLCRSCHRLHHREHGRPRRDARPAPSFAPPQPAGGTTAPARPSLLGRLLGRRSRA